LAGSRACRVGSGKQVTHYVRVRYRVIKHFSQIYSLALLAIIDEIGDAYLTVYDLVVDNMLDPGVQSLQSRFRFMKILKGSKCL